ncbi:hypothetical protein Rhe02_24980 [Rhizocola hellebori]|uniref:Uncharacterized protein n=1 Tax=Rhizocola hellebori TaxID=1392758 RepID=A0A8J3Q6Y1_9ACTN|nr:hypothetical protein [Rhizocola hellebori]GIH04431.1 hypothetical protein Rhe02_24980 [Rhizocola hellebori]
MLSERDQRRLEEGRKEAAAKMAQERRRIEEREELAAKAEQDAAQRRREAGIVDVVDPDGVEVMLHVQRTGIVAWASFDGGDILGFLLMLPILAVAFGLSWIAHLLFFTGSHTVHVTVLGSHTVKFREPSEEAAKQRLQTIAAAIKRDGVSALQK